MLEAIQPGAAAAAPSPAALPAHLPLIPTSSPAMTPDSYTPPATQQEEPEEHHFKRDFLAPILRHLSTSSVTAGLMRAISRKSEPLPTDGSIENLRRVDGRIWRGGQPGPLGYQMLLKQGIRASIDLAAEHQEEAGFLPQMGIKSLSLPLPPFGPPTMDEAVQFLHLALNPSNQPLYVHCYHGVDRTGTMIAVYRIVHDHLSADAAIKEMQDMGLHEDYNLDKIAFVRQFAAAWANDPALRQRVAAGLPPGALPS